MDCSCHSCLQLLLEKTQIAPVGVEVECPACTGTGECPHCGLDPCEICHDSKICFQCLGLKVLFY